MKKKIAVFAAIVLTLSLVMGTVAYAEGSDSGNGGTQQPQQTQQPQGSQGAGLRLQYMEQIRPLIQEFKQNREQIHTMNQTLLQLHTQTRTRLRDMASNPGTVTDEQIEQIKGLVAQIRECRDELLATNGQMVQERQALRTARRARNYEGMIAAYGSVIRIQEQRMTLLQQLTSLNQQILEV